MMHSALFSSSLYWCAGVALLVGAVVALQGCKRQPTAAERLEAFIKEKESGYGNTIVRDTVAGKPVVFLLSGCKVYLLEATPDPITPREVLRPGFLLWPTGCSGQKLWRDEEYLFAELINMEFGAGGGNASGGEYRSKDGTEWEKKTDKGWRPVATAQR